MVSEDSQDAERLISTSYEAFRLDRSLTNHIFVQESFLLIFRISHIVTVVKADKGPDDE
jgi:hypothetical protein